MDEHNSLDEVSLIATLLHDVYTNHVVGLTLRDIRLTQQKLRKRVSAEGLGFLTKTLSRLGKMLDSTLSGGGPLDCTQLRLERVQVGSKLPKLFGELFQRVLNHDGTVLQDPCTVCVRWIRTLCYLFYKYEVPYHEKDKQKVIDRFIETEADLKPIESKLDFIAASIPGSTGVASRVLSNTHWLRIVRNARISLNRLFEHFDPREILPRHGPGAVAGKQQLEGKYRWKEVPSRLTDKYPLDEYFYSSVGAVCDQYTSFSEVVDQEPSARVILVPKDSRGPRLISAEPAALQWIQQGLMQSIVRLVEHSDLTRYNVFFTNQQPNQLGALLGSQAGKYATLDLKDASDRISCSLVTLLFPSHVSDAAMAVRSLHTQLPSGEVLTLRKHAPMGSALCFPFLALTVWSLLDAAAPDRDTRESILVYGDDVIVPTAFAETAIAVLTYFGLAVNRDKSCIHGFFRESCGVDAYKGVNVTPVRIRTVWSTTSRSADTFASWVAYATSFYERKCFRTYDLIVSALASLYWPIAGPEQVTSPIRLPETLIQRRAIPKRWNPHLQRWEFRCLEGRPRKVKRGMNGWSLLLRYFTAFGRADSVKEPISLLPRGNNATLSADSGFPEHGTDVMSYTLRRTSILVRRWR